MNRKQILAANPLPDYLRNRGFTLYPAGSNFVTNACPLTLHKKFHRCVTIDTGKNLWHCNDHEEGGSVIDWLMHERNISAADALRELGGDRDGQSREVRSFASMTTSPRMENFFFRVAGKTPSRISRRANRTDAVVGSGMSKASGAFCITSGKSLEAELVLIAEGGERRGQSARARIYRDV